MLFYLYFVDISIGTMVAGVDAKGHSGVLTSAAKEVFLIMYLFCGYLSCIILILDGT
jgi:hypothetical protein